MRDDPQRRVVPGTVTALCVTAALLLGMARSGRGAAAPTPCCFTNERFAGECRVIPGDNESCGSILAYLNDPTSTGKTYCDRTTLRGDWIEVSCRTGTPKRQAVAKTLPSKAHAGTSGATFERRR